MPAGLMNWVVINAPCVVVQNHCRRAEREHVEQPGGEDGGEVNFGWREFLREGLLVHIEMGIQTLEF